MLGPYLILFVYVLTFSPIMDIVQFSYLDLYSLIFRVSDIVVCLLFLSYNNYTYKKESLVFAFFTPVTLF